MAMLTITSLSHNPTCYTSFKLKQCLFHTLVCIFETKISRVKKAAPNFPNSKRTNPEVISTTHGSFSEEHISTILYPLFQMFTFP